mmetsp:Transcript_13594/g.23143  ORF Transcript_13594/g.23143 Transcript_13594/m.23143 type:complete len:245 (-) Transcript_13594:1080-1814(-)
MRRMGWRRPMTMGKTKPAGERMRTRIPMSRTIWMTVNRCTFHSLTCTYDFSGNFLGSVMNSQMRSQNSLPARLDQPLYMNRPRRTARGMLPRAGRRKRSARRMSKWVVKGVRRCSRQPVISVPEGRDIISMAEVDSLWMATTRSLWLRPDSETERTLDAFSASSRSPSGTPDIDTRSRSLLRVFIDCSSIRLSSSSCLSLPPSLPKKHRERQWFREGTVADTSHGHPQRESRTVHRQSAIISMS